MTRSRALALGFALATALLGGCARDAPEARLRATLAALGESIESRDAGGIEAVLAEDFIGPDAMDRRSARRLAAASFMRYRNVRVAMGPARVEISGDYATVEFAAMLIGGAGTLLPDSARGYQVRSGWVLDDGDWKMRSIDWDATR